MKIVFCLLCIAVAVYAENCQNDSDCMLTVCTPNTYKAICGSNGAGTGHECTCVPDSLQLNCNNTIGQNDHAAELFLDSYSLQSSQNEGGECNVTVQPQHLGHVLFYFTEFNFGTRCRDNNVTVYDEDDSQILGALCGRNTSLAEKQSVFRSVGSSIRILYRWNSERERLSDTFKLMFVSFREGPCKSADTLFTCPDGHCIARDITCRDDLKACGANVESCDLYERIQSAITTVFGSVSNLFIIIVAIVLLIWIKRCWFNRWRRRYGDVKNFPIVRRLFGSQLTSLPRERRSVSHEIDSNEMLSLTERTDAGELQNEFDDGSQAGNTSQISATALPSVEIIQPQYDDTAPPTAIDATPPSYESLSNCGSDPGDSSEILPDSQRPLISN